MKLGCVPFARPEEGVLLEGVLQVTVVSAAISLVADIGHVWVGEVREVEGFSPLGPGLACAVDVCGGFHVDNRTQ